MDTTARRNGDPDLSSFDLVLVSSSGGKDSQTALRATVEAIDEAGLSRDMVVVVHADLGRVEWDDAEALAERQAAHYGLRFVSVRRPQGDLLDHVVDRHAKRPDVPSWPSSSSRYCTSDHKRGQLLKVYTALVNEWRERTGETRRARILEVLGLRAEESPARARKAKTPLELNARATTKTTREVWTWLPIADWKLEEVWASIRASGVEHHHAYDLGMGRLSCVFCVFAPREALIIAGRHNRELLDAYIEVEERTGYTIRPGFSLKSIRDAIEAGETVDQAAAWVA